MSSMLLKHTCSEEVSETSAPLQPRPRHHPETNFMDSRESVHSFRFIGTVAYLGQISRNRLVKYSVKMSPVLEMFLWLWK
jgi:hypothetical protein